MEIEQVEKFREFNEDVRRKTGLVIARVPAETRTNFIILAEKYFAEDYGMLLKWLMDSAQEYETMKINQDIKLNYIIQLLENQKIEEKAETIGGTEVKRRLFNRNGQFRKSEEASGQTDTDKIKE